MLQSYLEGGKYNQGKYKVGGTWEEGKRGKGKEEQTQAQEEMEEMYTGSGN